MTTDGFPDFDAVIANGGTVKGAVPPSGTPMMGYSSDYGTVVVYAAIIDLGDGSEPFMIKGGDAQPEVGASETNRSAMLDTLTYLYEKLPLDLNQARLWHDQGKWPTFNRESVGPRAELHVDQLA
ncbi:hypothetical protein [Pengzhenrongella sicca]|uniref:Uncharacterized protein n=1 Tax=Pengzhenrongella sicca TaxID=2819238 RepID=A0A8A4ZG12_9MICO|nr:hypothetical protein [Pengzhenrongella sicca]QTE28608.1 hypothetical protein J4E96_14760 [Pengzhenrongella sicca]